MGPYLLPSLSGGLLITAFIVYHAGAVHDLEDPLLIAASLALGAAAGFYVLYTTEDRPALRVAYTALTVIGSWLGIMCFSGVLSSF